MRPGNFKNLTVYKRAFALAMDVFELTKNFPKEETYSLTDQIRRSSRSVCSNIAESYRKRQYSAYFLSKVSDADMENSETQVWLDFASACNYIDADLHLTLSEQSEEVGRLLFHMMNYPQKYGVKND